MIHILWCTIRTEQFSQNHNNWISTAKNKSCIKTHVCVSSEKEADYIKRYFNLIKHEGEVIVFNPPYPGVCLPSYELSSKLEFNADDIIVFASDDFKPPLQWDDYLINKFKEKSGLLFVRDGYQLPDSSNMLHPAITIPIMDGHSLLKMNRIIYHPSYHHMFSDCELYLVAKELNILIDDRISDKTTFEHLHHAAGKRQADKFDVSYYNNWKDDEINWKVRQNLTIEEKIIV